MRNLKTTINIITRFIEFLTIQEEILNLNKGIIRYRDKSDKISHPDNTKIRNYFLQLQSKISEM
jgi:hypothetical protein